MTQVRARIGYSAVAYVTELLPKYFYQIAPDDVMMSILTLQIRSHSQEQFEDIHAQGLRAVESFARAGADVIIMGGAPTNLSRGPAALQQALAALSAKYGLPISTSSVAQGNALKALGAKRVGTINPAVPRQIGDSASGSLGDGMTLVGRKHAGALLEDPEIDTLIFGCPHWATIPAIEPLEQEFGVTVVTALQAIIWEGMRLAGVNDRIDGYGRLLREH